MMIAHDLEDMCLSPFSNILVSLFIIFYHAGSINVSLLQYRCDGNVCFICFKQSGYWLCKADRSEAFIDVY